MGFELNEVDVVIGEVVVDNSDCDILKSRLNVDMQEIFWGDLRISFDV